MLYIVHTSPNICYVVNYLSRFIIKLRVVHLNAAKRVMKYLTGTISHDQFYSSESSGLLEGFTHSDWGGSLSDRKSTLGTLCRIGTCSIIWSSKKQDVVALSLTEAEYIAATSAACQLVWLRRILGDCGRMNEGSFMLWCDNQSTIAIAKNPAYHGRIKQIDVRFHFIRSFVSDGLITLRIATQGINWLTF